MKNEESLSEERRGKSEEVAAAEGVNESSSKDTAAANSSFFTLHSSFNISLLSRVLDLICPRRCTACGCRLGVTEQTVCTPCLMHLPRTGYEACPDDNPVARLFWGQVRIERAASLFFFSPHSETARIIYRMKYYGGVDTCLDMGRILALEYAPAGFFGGIDVIIPVPLTFRRRLSRGYNQSELLARGIAEVTGLPVDTHVVVRTRFSISQTRLSRSGRMDNVDGLFRLRSAKDARRIACRHVLLVDDVVTSGATLMACARALMRAGGVRVSVLTLSFSHG